MERANISSILESVAALTVTHTLRGQEPPDLSCALNALVTQSLLGKLRIAARRANHTAPLVALSHAVLVRIFEGLELADRLSVSQTCHDLREVALRAPSLWSRLTYHEDRNCCYQCYDPDPNYRHRHSYPRSCNGQLLGAMLRRSEPELVNFNLSLDVGPEFGMLPHILETTLLPRAASLWLTLFHWGRRTHYLNWEETHLWIDTVHRDPLSNNDWRPYAATFKSAAPFLRTLSLRSPYSYSSSIPFAPEIPYDFLGGEPGRLEACRISGFSLPVIGCPAFASLTVFEYASPSSIVASFLQDILAQMPVLLTLGLTLDSFSDDTGDRGIISTFGIRNVGLRFNPIEAYEYDLDQIAARDMTAHLLVDFFIRRGVRAFGLNFDDVPWMRLPQALAKPIRLTERLSRVATLIYDDFSVRMTSLPGRGLSDHADRFDSLTRFLTSEQRLLLGAAPFQAARFPALKHLAIICESCVGCRSMLRDHLSVPPEEFLGVAWECPVLEEMSILFVKSCAYGDWGQACNEPASMPPQVMELILSNLIRPPTPQLSKLTLLNPGVPPDGAIERLRLFADSIELRALAGPEVPEILKDLQDTPASELWESTTAIFDAAFRSNENDEIWRGSMFPRVVTRNTRHLFTDHV